MTVIHSEDWRTVHTNLEKFLQFCLNHSEFIVLTKRTTSVPKEILHRMSLEQIEYIEKRKAKQLEFARKVSKEELCRIDMKDRESLAQYFQWQAKDEIQTVKQMEETYVGEKENLEEALKPYNIVSHEYKFGSFFTWPGVWDICTFRRSAFTMRQLKRIYLDEGISIGGYVFEDLGFKNGAGNIWMQTCLHEGFFEMELSDNQLDEFKKLGILYV